MTRWLVTGAGGMLGTDLVAALTSRGEPVTAMDRASLDVTDAAAVTDAIAGRRPDVVVNCAAWTAVDDAEASEEQALAVNAGAADRLRTHQAVRRAGRARPPARVGLRGQDGVAVRGARADLCPHHDQACRSAADGRRG